MAHRCPTCRNRCHCLGDIDDMMVEDAPEESTCICCPDEDQMEYDDGLDELGPEDNQDDGFGCELCGKELTSEDEEMSDCYCIACLTRDDAEQKCRVCGCTDDNCEQCVQKTGEPCIWVEEDLCSACVGDDKSTKIDVCPCGYLQHNCKMGISTDCPRTMEP